MTKQFRLPERKGQVSKCNTTLCAGESKKEIEILTTKQVGGE